MEHAPVSAPGGAIGDRSQGPVIEFLSSPAAYPDAPQSVSTIGTHAALIFLAGDRAYKLKRAVKLPYLDFSTLEQRRIALTRELAVNTQATPELYLSVLPVTRTPAGFELGGSGEAVEWLLVMRRFGQEALLDAVASEGRLTGANVADLAHTVEHFHRQAVSVPDAGFWYQLGRTAASLKSALCGPVAQAKGLHFKAYIEQLWQELEACGPLMAGREREGFVRRCHGDLHLKNIVLWEGRPRLFDAIEFDEAIATIDVLYDFAFLLMDLWHRGLKREANWLLNHYLRRAAISELVGLSLLPLFLSTRAAIRAMTGLQALAFQDSAAQEQTLKEAEAYGALAQQLLSPPPPVLVAIGGISGTGKTSVSREAAPFIGAVPGALHLRTDVERKAMQGVPLNQALPDDAYTIEARDEVYRRIFKKAEVALDAGHSVVVDAVFPDEESRAGVRALAQGAGVAFRGFWLEADASVIRQRIAARSALGTDASDADLAVAEAQMKSIARPQEWTGADASAAPEAVAASIVRELGV
jgi:uncharacterized protein